jgi:hypothetical protein
VLQISASYQYLREGLFILRFKEKALIQFMGKNTGLINVNIFGTFAADIKDYRYILFVYQFMCTCLYFIWRHCQYAHSPTCTISRHATWNKSKFEGITFLKRAPDLSWGECKRCDEGDGRILLGENKGGGTVLLRPIKFQGVGVWILTGPSCIHTHTHTHTQLAKCILNSDLHKIRLGPYLP